MKERMKRGIAFTLVLALCFTLMVALATTESYATEWNEPINYMWQHQCEENCSIQDHKMRRYEVRINDVKTNIKVSLRGHHISLACKNQSGESYLFRHPSKYTNGWASSNGLSLINENDSIDGTITLERGTYYFIVEFGNYGSNPDYNFSLHVEEIGDYATEVDAPGKLSLEVNEKKQVEYITYPKDSSVRIDFSSSDESVFIVSKKGEIEGIHTGTATLIMTLPNGIQRTCDVKVLGKTTTIRSQYGTCYDSKIKLRFNAVEKAVSYKIYRSTELNGIYSCIKVVTPKQLSGEKVLLYVDNTVKADKKYYYKVAVKTKGESKYGEPSKAVGYWTSPERKFKGKLSGRTISWEKVKGADGYWLHGTAIHPHYKFGYHLWDDVYDYTTTTKKTKYSIGGYYTKFYNVRIYPYAKHNGKYYANGKPIANDMGYWEEGV